MTAGAVSGFLATFPMTAAMKLQHRFLPLTQKQSLPPKKITMRILHSASVWIPVHKRKQRKMATAVGHYGYGAGTGALFPLVMNDVSWHPAGKGAAYGLIVWAASYLGWLPATGLLNPQEETKTRQGLMIASHVVWGSFLGLFHHAIASKSTLSR